MSTTFYRRKPSPNYLEPLSLDWEGHPLPSECLPQDVKVLVEGILQALMIALSEKEPRLDLLWKAGIIAAMGHVFPTCPDKYRKTLRDTVKILSQISKICLDDKALESSGLIKDAQEKIGKLVHEVQAAKRRELYR